MREELKEKLDYGRFFEYYPAFIRNKDDFDFFIYNDKKYLTIKETKMKVHLKYFMDDGITPRLSDSLRKNIRNTLLQLNHQRKEKQKEIDIDCGRFFEIFPRLEPYKDHLEFIKTEYGKECRIRGTEPSWFIYFKDDTPYFPSEKIKELYRQLQKLFPDVKEDPELETKILTDILKQFFGNIASEFACRQIDENQYMISMIFPTGITAEGTVYWNENTDVMMDRMEEKIDAGTFFEIKDLRSIWKSMQDLLSVKYPWLICDNPDNIADVVKNLLSDYREWRFWKAVNGYCDASDKDCDIQICFGQQQIIAKVRGVLTVKTPFHMEDEPILTDFELSKKWIRKFQKRYMDVAEFFDSFSRNYKRVRNISQRPIDIQLRNQGEDGIKITLTANGKKYSQLTDKRHLRSTFAKLCRDAITANEKSIKKEKEEQKKKEMLDGQWYGTKMETSNAYGSFLVADILKLIKESDNPNTSFHASKAALFSELKAIHPSLRKDDINKPLDILCKENLCRKRKSYGTYRSYERYSICSNYLADLFMEPKNIRFGKNKDFDHYTDADWKALLERENNTKLSIKSWEKRLLVLDHYWLLESCPDTVRKYFQNAPAEIKEYLKMYIKEEKSHLRKAVLQEAFSSLE